MVLSLRLLNCVAGSKTKVLPCQGAQLPAYPAVQHILIKVTFLPFVVLQSRKGVMIGRRI